MSNPAPPGPPPQGHTESHVYFMDLPQEIRDMVYHELWKNRVVGGFEGPQLHYDVPKGRRDFHPRNLYRCTPGRDGLPRWLLCSRTIFAEGLKQLYIKASWTLCLPRFKSHKAQSSQLIGSTVMTNLRLHQVVLDRKSTGPQYVCPSFDRKIMTYTSFRKLKRLIVEVTHKDKTVGPPYPTTWGVDLSFLNGLRARLSSLRIVSTGHSEVDPASFMPSLRTAYEVETKRIGARLIGQDGQMKSSIDFGSFAHRPRQLSFYFYLTLQYYRTNA